MASAELYSQTLDLSEGSGSAGHTEVRIGAGVLSKAGELLGDWVQGRTLFILSTPNLRRLHGATLDPVRAAARRVVELETVDGEAAKTTGEAAILWERMLAAGGKRDSRLLSFGGGSVSDLGGFVAGTFLRGIACVHCPTTLLAQVDAALGGKTGVDLSGGKNTVGLFLHPDWVLSDTLVLATLPLDELRSGLMEAVKMAYLLDPPGLERIEATLPDLLAGRADALAPVVAAATATKLSVVAADPREGNRRRLLNFGHTLGHAIEGVLGYEDLRHGDAIAYGMLFALTLGEGRGLPAADADRLRQLLGRAGLPALPSLDAADLLAYVGRDKKATEGGVTWVLPRRLGEGEMVLLSDLSSLRPAIERFLADPWGHLAG